MLYIVEGGRRSKRPAPRLARGRGAWIDAHGTPIDDAGPQARSLARALTYNTITISGLVYSCVNSSNPSRA
jgi:hypothetical protein